jgi:hypothetical protein
MFAARMSGPARDYRQQRVDARSQPIVDFRGLAAVFFVSGDSRPSSQYQ